MLAPPIFHVEQIDRAFLNRHLIAWGHRMGPYARPHYTVEAHHALFFHGRPIAVTATGDTPREVVGDTLLLRSEVVELCRLCAEGPNYNRVMLRLWREGLFPAIAAVHGRHVAVSYQDEAMHNGDTYRTDGWVRIGKGGGGGRDSRSGRKGRSLAIWGWPQDVLGTVVARRKARAA